MKFSPTSWSWTLRLGGAFLLVCSLLLCVSPSKANGIHPFQASQEQPGIAFIWPHTGETFYAGPTSLIYHIPVQGKLVNWQGRLEGIDVRLEVWQDNLKVGELVRATGANGEVTFLATVNPHGMEENFQLALRDCGYTCHSSGELDLRPGRLLLVLTATADNGQILRAERAIKVDYGAAATTPVQVVLEDDPSMGVEGVRVATASWMYQWRARFGLTVSGPEGWAQAPFEALEETPTRLLLHVDPTVVDGVLYEGITSEEIVLTPGGEKPTVVLKVRSRQGSLHGKVTGSGRPDSYPVLAVQLPAGRAFTTQGDSDSFQFNDLPVAEYLIAPDPIALEERGWQSNAQPVDLFPEPNQEISLTLVASPGQVVQGTVQDEAGQPLPFAWVSLEGSSKRARVFPVDGSFQLGGLPESAQALVAVAPGYFSQVQPIPSKGEELVFRLKKQPETGWLAWGEGGVNLPVESSVVPRPGGLRCEYGWLWGRGKGQALQLDVQGNQIRFEEASFALEVTSEGGAWLYLIEGKAEVVSADQANPTVLASAGEMVFLGNIPTFEPVIAEPSAVRLLTGNLAPIQPKWEPGGQAQLRNSLARLGISTAQLLTFLTYALALPVGTATFIFVCIKGWRNSKYHLFWGK